MPGWQEEVTPSFTPPPLPDKIVPLSSEEHSHLESTACGDDLETRNGGEDAFEMELEKRWILNLSMQFRDKSRREKFFVTYAEAPNRWRRVTISCDYGGAPLNSLEEDLKELHYQSDKSARIYESIRESLPEIQFYHTVTNLKLETIDGRLHVHVTEDINEIIPYPLISSVHHLEAPLIPEYRLNFDAHQSGFVYKVRLDGQVYIKKEIPGPDTVDEFLYELNALHDLKGSQSVIEFGGVVVDDASLVVKGLLIRYAEQGPLIDLLYNHRGQLPWARRERWAKQIVQGLCEIHEAGYVQGDFTLSNIVIDADDDAKIIDINRRGCPVGWEPPEMAEKIASNQRISMYIGVKSDIFQLGMTLWALAMEDDEPERRSRPLVLGEDAKVPDYYRTLVSTCLSPRPQDRLSAKDLLAIFPPDSPRINENPTILRSSQHSPDGSAPRYSLSRTLSGLEDEPPGQETYSNVNVVYVTPDNLLGPPEEPLHDLLDDPPRGRQPSANTLRLSDYQLSSNASPNRERSQSLSQTDFERFLVPEPYQEPRFEEVDVAGIPYLVQKDALDFDQFQDLGDHAPFVGHMEDLPRGPSSSVSRVVVPSMTGDVSKEVEIDLEATVDPLYRNPKLSNQHELGTFQIDALSGDLAGVGGNPACSLEQDRHRHRQRHHPNHPYHGYLHTAFGVAEAQQPSPGSHLITFSQMATLELPSSLTEPSDGGPRPSAGSRTSSPTGRVFSLLDSRLPINPALSQPTKTERPPPGPPLPTCSLLESMLPINPAFPVPKLEAAYSGSSVSVDLLAGKL
jgi:serine/threonine protein kinase